MKVLDGLNMPTIALSDLPLRMLGLQFFCRLTTKRCGTCKDRDDATHIIFTKNRNVLHHLDDDWRNLPKIRTDSPIFETLDRKDLLGKEC